MGPGRDFVNARYGCSGKNRNGNGSINSLVGLNRLRSYSGPPHKTQGDLSSLKFLPIFKPLVLTEFSVGPMLHNFLKSKSEKNCPVRPS